jgi:hypothetical protein
MADRRSNASGGRTIQFDRPTPFLLTVTDYGAGVNSGERFGLRRLDAAFFLCTALE